MVIGGGAEGRLGSGEFGRKYCEMGWMGWGDVSR